MKGFALILDIVSALHECFWILYLAKKLLNAKIDNGKFGKLIIGLTFVGYSVLNLMLQTSPYVILVACLFMIGVLYWFGKGKLFVTSAIVAIYHIVLYTVKALVVVCVGIYCSKNSIPIIEMSVIDKNYLLFRLLVMIIWLLINWGISKGLQCKKSKKRKLFNVIIGVIIFVVVVLVLRNVIKIPVLWSIFYVANIAKMSKEYYFFEAFMPYVIIFLLLNVVYGIYVIFTYRRVLYEQDIVMERNELLEEKYTQLNDYYTSNAKLYHDINSHLRLIGYMAQKHKIAEIIEYVEGIETSIKKGIVSTWTGLGVVDAILSEHDRKAKESGIDFEIDSEMIPENICIENWELCSLFSNLLSNCMEAKPTKVSVKVKMVGQMLLVRTQNDYVGERKKVDGHYESSKEDGKTHGWGIRNIEEIAEKYEGNVEMQEFKGIFCVDVMLNIH